MMLPALTLGVWMMVYGLKDLLVVLGRIATALEADSSHR